MITDLEENYLAHFGVKGMKWGKTKRPERTSEQKAETRRKIKKAAVIGGSIALVAGTAAVAVMLNKKGNVPLSTIGVPAPKSGPTVSKNILDLGYGSIFTTPTPSYPKATSVRAPNNDAINKMMADAKAQSARIAKNNAQYNSLNNDIMGGTADLLKKARRS